MDIFESLENLNVSEECFDDILILTEEIINEVSNRKVLNTYNQRVKNVSTIKSKLNNYEQKMKSPRISSENKEKYTKKLEDLKDKLGKAEDKLERNKQLTLNYRERNKGASDNIGSRWSGVSREAVNAAIEKGVKASVPSIHKHLKDVIKHDVTTGEYGDGIANYHYYDIKGKK